MRKQIMGSGVEGWGHPQPNHRLQPTPSSLRSYVASASGRG